MASNWNAFVEENVKDCLHPALGTTRATGDTHRVGNSYMPDALNTQSGGPVRQSSMAASTTRRRPIPNVYDSARSATHNQATPRPQLNVSHWNKNTQLSRDLIAGSRRPPPGPSHTVARTSPSHTLTCRQAPSENFTPSRRPEKKIGPSRPDRSATNMISCNDIPDWSKIQPSSQWDVKNAEQSRNVSIDNSGSMKITIGQGITISENALKKSPANQLDVGGMEMIYSQNPSVMDILRSAITTNSSMYVKESSGVIVNAPPKSTSSPPKELVKGSRSEKRKSSEIFDNSDDSDSLETLETFRFSTPKPFPRDIRTQALHALYSVLGSQIGANSDGGASKQQAGHQVTSATAQIVQNPRSVTPSRLFSLAVAETVSIPKNVVQSNDISKQRDTVKSNNMNPLDFESESDEDVLKKQTEEQTMVSRSSAITNLPKMLDLLFFQSDSEDDIQTVRSCSTIKPRNTGTSKEQTRRRKVVERHLGEYGSQEANRGAQFLDDQTENDCHGQAQVVGHENGNDLQETNHDVKVKDDQKPFSQPIETPPAFEAVENPSEGNMTGTLANGPQKVLARSSEGIIRKSSLQLNREIPKLHLRDDPAASGKSGWDSPSWELPLLLPVKFAPRFVQDPFVQVSNEPRDPSRRREIKFSRIFDNVPECRAVEMLPGFSIPNEKPIEQSKEATYESVNTVNLGTHTEISVGTIYHLNDAESLSPSPTEPSNEPLSVNNSSDLIDHGATGEETNRILGILCFKAAAAEVSIRASEVKETKPDSFAKQNSSQLGIQLQTMVGVGTTITVNDQIVIPPQKYSESPTQLKGATVSEGDSPSQSLTPNDAKFSREPLVAQNFAGAVATNTTARKPSITTHVSTSTSPFKQTGHTEKIEASTSWVLHLQFTPQHSYTFQLRDVGRSERLHILIAAYIVDALCPVLNETGDNVSGTGQLGKVSLCKEFICIVGKPMRQALVK